MIVSYQQRGYCWIIGLQSSEKRFYANVNVVVQKSKPLLSEEKTLHDYQEKLNKNKNQRPILKWAH